MILHSMPMQYTSHQCETTVSDIKEIFLFFNNMYILYYGTFSCLCTQLNLFCTVINKCAACYGQKKKTLFTRMFQHTAKSDKYF
jgi:hypothetical protein